MMKRMMQAAALTALTFTPGSANTGDISIETLKFSAHIGGLRVGEVNLNVEREGDLYEANARFDMIKIIKMFLDTDANATVAGYVTEQGPRPVRFEYFVRDREKTRNTEILFDDEGNAAELHANPPFKKRPYSIELEEAAGAFDPATAVLALSTPRAEPCSFKMDVFDGRKIHRLTLIKATRTSADKQRVTCSGRYDRVAGFRDKDMTKEKRSYPFNATLTKTADEKWIPTRIWAKTKFGAAVVNRIQ